MNATNSREINNRKNTQTWYLVTNHQNLLYMLAAGLVMEPSDFGGKYYTDSLSTMPGWISLFRNKIPAQALEQAISERKHLRPCVVSFNLSDVSGSVKSLSKTGRISNKKLKTKNSQNVAFLIPAPLPVSMFSRICFSSIADQQAFEIAAGDVSNVDLSPYQIEVDEILFSDVTDAVWPPLQTRKPQPRSTKVSSHQQDELPLVSEDTPQGLEAKRTHPPISAQALGGLLAMLYHSANRSELGVGVFQLATGLKCDADRIAISEPILAELPNWLDGSGVSEQADTPARLYWGVVDALGADRGANNQSQPVEVVLEYLDNQLALLAEQNVRSRLERLIADMRSCLGLGSETITKIFERNKGSLSRPLLLFCLREHCADLLEFSHPLLSDAEYSLASILFGVRDGWLQLPSELRPPILSTYVVFRMAIVTHQKQGDDLFFEKNNTVPKPLRTFFSTSASSWSDNQRDAALDIVRTKGWRDCIETIVTSADGTPLDSPRLENGKYFFSGEVKLTTKIEREVFFRHLGEWPPIDTQLESRVREIE